ncbi:hypothetical protein DPMN_187468 [Dreissena polymorpha]|uniref:Uncharacterized protein n=1 Tax=Dreissena polymorpha TaxID=45954 RepID=A0A9D4DRM5_DREPO|nr:hypothetical protein DPMN_187468 [Dreissena polymorpha]
MFVIPGQGYTSHNCSFSELEWMLSQTGAVNTDLEEAPRREVKDIMNAIRDSAKVLKKSTI